MLDVKIIVVLLEILEITRGRPLIKIVLPATPFVHFCSVAPADIATGGAVTQVAAVSLVTVLTTR